MTDCQYEVRRWILFTISVLGFVSSQINRCLPKVSSVYLSEDDCIFMCSTRVKQNGYLLCKSDGRTAIPCVKGQLLATADCIQLSCQTLPTTECRGQPATIFKDAHFVITLHPTENETLFPTYIHTETKPKIPWSNREIPKISFEEPDSQIYIYGILSFFFGVIAFFIFALVFRFIYKRYQRHPVHVHTFSGHHQVPLGGLRLRSFLSPSAPQESFSHMEQNGTGIPGLDLPPSYVVASELLDPPPSYDNISKSKGFSAQQKITSL